MGGDEGRSRRCLSPQEVACLNLLAAGYTNKEVARELDLSPTTVASYLKSIFQKLGVETRGHAIAVALRRGLIDGC